MLLLEAGGVGASGIKKSWTGDPDPDLDAELPSVGDAARGDIVLPVIPTPEVTLNCPMGLLTFMVRGC